MSDDLRTHADRNLNAAAAALGLADPRPAYRERLRLLKDDNPGAFADALRYYEQTVLPALATDGGDAMAAWVEYGSRIAALTTPGRMHAVDATGAAAKYSPPVREGILLLHIPDDNTAPILVAASPSLPTPAQQATLDLLVHRKLGLA